MTMDEEAVVRKFQKELNSGTAALAVLGLMRGSDEPMYGYQIGQAPGENARRAGCPMKQGALYPVLRVMETRGLLQSQVQPSISAPPRRYYTMTESGQPDAPALDRDLDPHAPSSSSGCWTEQPRATIEPRRVKMSEQISTVREYFDQLAAAFSGSDPGGGTGRHLRRPGVPRTKSANSWRPGAGTWQIRLSSSSSLSTACCNASAGRRRWSRSYLATEAQVAAALAPARPAAGGEPRRSNPRSVRRSTLLRCSLLHADLTSPRSDLLLMGSDRSVALDRSRHPDLRLRLLPLLRLHGPGRGPRRVPKSSRRCWVSACLVGRLSSDRRAAGAPGSSSGSRTSEPGSRSST